MLPTFVVLGAMKCGTTSLYYALRRHPEVRMSRVKETDFFIAGRGYEQGLAAYAAHFPGGGRARGECAPNYTKRHLFPGVAARLHDALPHARLVYAVRDPVARTLSHYAGRYVEGTETRAPEAALRPFAASNYVQTSRYHWQLAPYLDRFSRARLHVLSLDALRAAPDATMQRLFRFLEVDDGVTGTAERAFNRSAPKTRRGPLLRFVTKRLLPQRLKDRLRPYVPVGRLPGRAVAVPPVPDALRADLAAYLRPDADALRALTGAAFAEWTV
jgi:phytoene dehydrogenase-like protein